MGMGIKAVLAPWGWLEFAVTRGNGDNFRQWSEI